MYKIFGPITATMSLTRIILSAALFLSISTSALAQDLFPAIEIQPSVSVEVGEEVYLSATGTKYPDESILAKARYEWDFGDGYYHRFDPSVTTITRSGIAVTHYYMKPGDFSVTLRVSLWAEWDSLGTPIGAPLSVETATKVIRVTGEKPMAGFEIQRAPFHNRLAQYLHVQIPEAYRGSQTSLRVTLQGAKGSSTVLLSKNKLASEELVFLDHKPLAQDDFVVIAELLGTDGQRISGGLWRDKFSKRYQGIPKVGIDENNAFRVNGEVFFPVSTFMASASEFQKFTDQANINSLHTVGYNAEQTAITWGNYLDSANNSGFVATGPARGDYYVPKAYWSPSSANRWPFNHNPDRMAEYVQLNKDKPAMFSWGWQDEPNLGGRAQKVYPPTLAAWTYVAHREDPHHPVNNTFYGPDWSINYGTAPNIYDYLGSDQQFGGKKWMQDIFSFDIYPIATRLHPSMNLVAMGPYAAYLDALDRIHTNNKNLVPVMPAINPSNRNPNETVLVHSSEQVYSEAWMSVIHGAKGIIWFPYFDPISIRWDAMKKFGDQMDVLAPVVLQPEPTLTVVDDANVALNRVDTMVREYAGNVYIFAARITEPDPIEGSLYRGVEPESITVNFTVSGLSSNGFAEVMDEKRDIPISSGQFKDAFGKNDVHIYKISNEGTRPQKLRFIE